MDKTEETVITYTVVKKKGKFWLSPSCNLFPDSMIYSVKNNPYIKMFCQKYYLSDENKAQLAALI